MYISYINYNYFIMNKKKIIPQQELPETELQTDKPMYYLPILLMWIIFISIFILSSIDLYQKKSITTPVNNHKNFKMEWVSKDIEIKPSKKITDTFWTYDFKTLTNDEKTAKMEFYKKLGINLAQPNQSLLNQEKMQNYIKSIKIALETKFWYSWIENERMKFLYNWVNFICKPYFKWDFVSKYRICLNDNNEEAPNFLKEINEFLKNYTTK